MNALPPPHHNNPPAVDPDVLDPLWADTHLVCERAGQWLDEGEITDAVNASRAGDCVEALRQIQKRVDTARIEAKRPHDEAAKAVQAAFKALLDPIEAAHTRLKAMLAAYAARVRAEEEAAKDARVAELQREREGAQAELDRARHANDVIGEAAAVHHLTQIEDALAALGKPAPGVRIASASGGGRTLAERTRRVAKIENLNRALMHYRHHPDVAALLERLATADLRGPKAPESIPGFTIITERTVA